MTRYQNLFIKIGILFALFSFKGAFIGTAAEDDITRRFHVDIIVNLDHSYDVNETITMDFGSRKHGIQRNIPFRGSFYRKLADGLEIDERMYTAKVSQIKVLDDKFKVSTEDDDKHIRIGNSNKYYLGYKNYQFSYQWNPGDDGLEEIDDFYYNVIPQNWQHLIKEASFSIELPKEAATSQLDVIVGDASGKIIDQEVNYQVKGRHLTGQVVGPLLPGHGLTVYWVLPPDYYVNARNGSEYDLLWFTLLSVICLSGTYLASRYTWSKSTALLPVTQLQGNLTPVEAAYLLKGKLTNRDLMTIIFSLAKGGYLTIDYQKRPFFILTKLKELPPSAEAYEYHMMAGLFPGSSWLATSATLKSNFHTYLTDARSSVEKKLRPTVTAMIEPKSQNRHALLSLLLVITIYLSLFIFILRTEYFISALSFFLALIFTIFLCLPIVCYFKLRKGLAYEDGLTYYLKRLVAFCILPLPLITLTVGFVLILLTKAEQTNYSYIALACLLTTSFLLILISRSPRRTDFGNQLHGELLSYRRYLTTLTPLEIKELLAEQPDFYYEVFLYAEVFGLTKPFARKFKTYGIKPPKWLSFNRGKKAFNVSTFSNQLHHDFYRTSYSPSDSFSSDSDSSSSGGYSSGGGGGGGGGSW